MRKLFYCLYLLLIFLSCKKENEKEGCTNPKAANYDREATIDNGSCSIKYAGVYFITDSLFVNGNFNEIRAYELTL